MMGPKKKAGIPGLFNGLILNLNFFYNDGAGFANFHTAFTAQAFIHVNRNGFVVLKLENTHRAGIHAIGITGAFVGVNRDLKH
jgi:hypothetical protein